MLSPCTGLVLFAAAALALAAPQGATTPNVTIEVPAAPGVAGTTQPNVTIEVPAPPGVTVANSAALCYFQCGVVPIDTTKCTTADGSLDPQCGCKDETAQATITACFDKTCPAVKDQATAYNKALCDPSIGAKAYDSIGCVFDTCLPTLAEPIKTACGADADTKGECACTSPAVQTALDGCLSKNATCAGLADIALLTYDMFCPLGGLNFTIHVSGDLDLNTTITGTFVGDKPAETGAPQGRNNSDGATGGNDGDNGAKGLSRGGLAVALSVLAVAATIIL